jgi:hypothetical protein
MQPRTATVVACLTAITLLTLSRPSDAQHVHPDTSAARPAKQSMAGALGISMDRPGSGTTWIPDAVTLPSRMWMAGKWMLMIHGFVFAQYDWQDGPRGDSQFGSLNWAMLMADRELAGGKLQFRFMPSLDPLTVGRCGYPLLAQSGETCHGVHLVDRQHPHDFFMELAALYERPITSKLAAFVYAGPSAEPALGPVAYMHRPSAMDEPQAPLGHHWQDATHTSFGVVTAGLFTRRFKLEGSAFNGHMPDEDRWNFDRIELNSFSGRITLSPTRHWSFTAGYGVMDNPELATPAANATRFVGSAMHGRALGTSGQWATTFVYGWDRVEGEEGSHSALLESEALLDQHNTVFGRFELVQKSAHHLNVFTVPHDHRFNVSAASVGYIRELARGAGVTVGLGARGTVNILSRELEASYGSRTPLGAMVFLRVRPHHSDGHEGHDGHSPSSR